MSIEAFLKSAVISIWTNKTRSALTLLGVIIGVATVISMISIIDGINKYTYSVLGGLGSKTLYIQKYPWLMGGGRDRKKRRMWARNPNFTLQDAEALRHLDIVDAASATQRASITYIIKRNGYMFDNPDIQGVEQYDNLISNIEIVQGRWLNFNDIQFKRKVCVIGYAVAKELFGASNPCGREVKIGPYTFTVLGTLKEKGSFLGNNMDNVVYIPITVLRQYFVNKWRSRLWGAMSIEVKLKDNVPQEQGVEQIEEFIRKRRKLRFNQKDNFFINTSEMILDAYKKLTKGIFFAMIGIASLALIVGGVGIMNIMLVSVTERTREIGIRMAVGAKRRHIMLQFLIEANILTISGGVTGIIIGFTIARLISVLTPLKSSVSLWSVLLGIVFSIVVGVFFGIYPAHRASKLDPVEALRYE